MAVDVYRHIGGRRRGALERRLLSSIPSRKLKRWIRAGVDRAYPTYYGLLGHRGFNRSLDAMVASYPKSGRTWLRTVLAKYFERVSGVPVSFELGGTAVAGVPAVGFTHLLVRARYWQGPLALFVRDPRDVVVSHYHYRTAKGKFSGTVSEFVHGHYGVPTIVAYLNELARSTADNPQRLFVRYEDMKREPLPVVTSVLRLLSIEVYERAVEEALEFSRFENLQKLERRQELPKRWFRTASAPQSDNALKVRKGQVGGYVNELSREDIEFAERIITERLHPVAYPQYRGGRL